MKHLILSLLFTSACIANTPMHFIFVTIDDLSRESLGIHGCTIPNISPNMDTLAQEGIRFDHVHVQSANCTPSRNIISSGQYQQNNLIFQLGKEGAGNHKSFPAIPDVFRAAGYHTGLMGKNSHMSAFEPYSGFDIIYDSYGSTREPQNIYDKITQAYADAATEGKPLYFNLNIYDPHTGWYNWDHKNGEPSGDTSNAPSALYTKNDVPYPSWFPSLSAGEQIDSETGYSLMDEIAAYYNTVKRCDDSIGKMLKAIEDAEATENTIIVLVSDHGAQLPGAKTQLYDHSTRSPLFVKWPGVTTANTVDNTHMIASFDLLPTFCEMIGQPIPADVDGRSFAPLLQGGSLPVWRDYVYKQQNDRNKMRALQTTQWLYIFNPWSNGTDQVGSVATGMLSWRLIQAAGAAGNTAAQDYADFFLYREVEELYDVANDPDCLINLAQDPTYTSELNIMRARMEQEMIDCGDDLVLPAFQNRTDPIALSDYIDANTAMQDAMKDDPEHLRNVFYDPHDDWMDLGHTIFEPFGEWGIWNPDTTGVSLVNVSANTIDFNTGQNMVEFDGSVADQARLTTSSIIDTSAMERLKLDFQSADDAAFGNGATLQLQFDDGNGWQTFKTISNDGAKNEICELPAGGLPDAMRFGVLCDFNGSGGKIYIDDLRLTAWQDWSPQPNNAPFDATNHATIRLTFEFETSNFSTTDRLLLEYYNGTSWELLKAYDYSYVLLDGKRYSEVLDLDPGSTAFTDAIEFRFRSETTDAGQSFALYNYQIESRDASGNTIRALDDSYASTEPRAIVIAAPGILDNDSAGPGSPLQAELVSGVSHGILEFNSDGSFVYAATNGYTGEDSFTYRAINEEVSNTATVTLTTNSSTIPSSGELPFSDDFESATTGGSGTAPGWTDEGATWIGSSDGVGDSIGVRMRSGNSLMTKPLDTSGYTDINITFQGKSEGLSSGEEMALQWSADGSTNWQTVGIVPHTVTTYQEFNFEFPEGAENNPSFALRFKGNAPSNTERGYFDNVVVTGTPMSADPISSFNEWATTHGVAETDDALLDYAFNINPHLSKRYTMSGNSGLPLWDFSETNSDRLTIQFIRRIQAADISYIVQFTGDLKDDWDDATTTEVVIPIDSEFEQVSVSDTMTPSAAHQRFARVKVESLP